MQVYLKLLFVSLWSCIYLFADLFLLSCCVLISNRVHTHWLCWAFYSTLNTLKKFIFLCCIFHCAMFFFPNSFTNKHTRIFNTRNWLKTHQGTTEPRSSGSSWWSERKDTLWHCWYIDATETYSWIDWAIRNTGTLRVLTLFWISVFYSFIWWAKISVSVKNILIDELHVTSWHWELVVPTQRRRELGCSSLCARVLTKREVYDSLVCPQ